MDPCIYHIRLCGQIAEEEVNRMTPLWLQWETGDAAVTQFAVATDQAGFIGLMRHLHSKGYVFESFERDES